MKHISIIIPTYNEEGNISLLVKRIYVALKDKYLYEVIVVDDHSTDRTAQHVEELGSMYPVFWHTKKGKPGKAQSLLEGFSYARYELLCMIDGDLQYPPEAIPEMIEKIEQGADVVVANRREFGASLRRRILSKVFKLFFGKFLHGFNCDVQSGLKIFRKQIIERISLHPSPWTFDLEFLIKSRDAGYKIENVHIDFHKRFAGTAKIGLISASIQMGWNALQLALESPSVIPFHRTQEKKRGKGFHYKGIEFIPHNSLHHTESAFFRLSLIQISFLSAFLTILSIGFYTHWHTTVVIFVALLTCLYFADLLFNFFLIWRSFSRPPEIQISNEELAGLDETSLPKYTIFCPLYKEWDVLSQFITAMTRMEYPKDKLQIVLLLEQDDIQTIEKARGFYLPSYFQIVIIPHSMPKTKPKALNYGLIHATGEYSVIYDAEDVPDPLQLKKALLAFAKSDEKTICIQAKLNFYNPHQNLLTKIFTTEYSLWFDLVLTGLQSIKAPIPLGGTSNHFRTKDLRSLHGWDAFNVTEDCDLGMRLVKRGYRTAIIDSLTYEEANSDLLNWFRQRTRWVKGYIQTYLVHMRRPHHFIHDWREPHVVTFQLIVGGKILSMFINPFMWVITILYFVFRPIIGPTIESFFPTPVFYMAVFSLIFGNFLYMYYYMVGCAKREQWELIKYAFIVPLYWLCMSIASWIAVYRIIGNPYYWSKTHHGLHLKNKKAVIAAKHFTGKDLVDENIILAPVKVYSSKEGDTLP